MHRVTPSFIFAKHPRTEHTLATTKPTSIKICHHRHESIDMDYDGQHHDGQQIPIVALDQALLDEQKALGGHCEDFEDRNGDAEENLIVVSPAVLL